MLKEVYDVLKEEFPALALTYKRGNLFLGEYMIVVMSSSASWVRHTSWRRRDRKTLEREAREAIIRVLEERI